MHTLSDFRLHYQPTLPRTLSGMESLAATDSTLSQAINKKIEKHFPKTFSQPIIGFHPSETRAHSPLRVGVVLSGGQAAGGHNVIIGLYDALKKLNPQSTLYGFLNGPGGIVKNQHIELTADVIAPYRNQGGFDMIGSGRTKIETAEQFDAAARAVSGLRLDGLVIIGGDDSNTNAALLAEYFLEKAIPTTVVGAPKTIDGDLKNAYIEIPFGFDSATKTYAEIIGNIMRDALSQKKYWFFIKLMGRSASHITLECALQTHPNYAMIGEEIAAKRISLAAIVDALTDLVIMRSKAGKDYGVVLIPEGVIEFIPEFRKLIDELNILLSDDAKSDPHNFFEKLSEKSAHCFASLPKAIQEQLIMDRDPHGNVQVSKIETERLFIELVRQNLIKRQYKGSFNTQPLFCGYEGRSCLPSNFDSQYCNALGYVAALLVDARKTGYMSCIRNLAAPVEGWGIAGVPIAMMMTLESRKGVMKPVIAKALVEMDSASYKSFAAQREQWAVGDHYRYPGPMQFYGPDALTNPVPFTLVD